MTLRLRQLRTGTTWLSPVTEMIKRRCEHAIHDADDPEGVRERQARQFAGRQGDHRDHDEIQRVAVEGGRAAWPGWSSSAIHGCARKLFSGKAKGTDGPFAEAKEVIGGNWMIQVESKEEALEWASHCRPQTTK